MTEPTDQDLLGQIAQRNTEALRTLYARFGERVYNLAFNYLRDRTEAEEVTQDVFVKVWNNAERFRADSQVLTWIYRITINTALTARKKAERRKLFSLTRPAVAPETTFSAEAASDAADREQALLLNIYRLPERQKTAFLLSYVEELPRQRVAEVMNTSLKSVESLLIRGKRNLRTQLADQHPGRGKSTKP